MNIQMQLCGIILMLVLLYFYKSQKKIELNTEIAFLRVYAFTFISLLLDITSTIAIKYQNSLSSDFITFIYKSYLASLILVVLFCFYYVCTDIYSNSKDFSKIADIFAVGSGLAIGLTYALPLHIQREASTSYSYGESVLAVYICIFMIMMSILILMQKNKAKIAPNRRGVVWVWMTFASLSTILQFVNKDFPIVGFANAVGVLIIYLKLENPVSNIDRKTGLFTKGAFRLLATQLFENGEDFSILYLPGVHQAKKQFQREVALEIKAEIVTFISKIPHSLAFKSADDELILLIKDLKETDSVIARLKDGFSTGWGRNNSAFISLNGVFIRNALLLKAPEDIFPLIRSIKKNQKEADYRDFISVDEELVEKFYEDKKIEKLIVDAIEQNKIEVFYQPIYSTKEKRFVCAEALARIRDENGVLVPPSSFIHIAEQNGLILSLGSRVFESVCRFIKEQQPQRFGLKYIEVNLSVVQCGYELLADSFIEIMKQYDIDPKSINLEITESASIKGRKILLDNMKRLLDYGVTFSLDDFGTGQSNLDYIAQMPVHFVKFDKSMTSSYFSNGKSKYVMEAAMQMIHGMKLHIVSEGIETKEQFQTMVNLGISYIQGYYFSKPIPKNEFLSFLRDHSLSCPKL